MNLESTFDLWLRRPMSGTKGLHQDIFTAAAFLCEEGWSDDDIFDILHRATEDAGRPVPDREVRGAIDYARRKAAGLVTPLSHPWPARNDLLRAEVIRQYAIDTSSLSRLLESTSRGDLLTYLHRLYRPTDLLCIGKSAFEFGTFRLQDIPPETRDLSACEFITPNPMCAAGGLTKDERWSSHTMNNTGPRVYAIIEFDDGQPPAHAAIIKHLARLLPLVMIVFSGKTSLHGWFRCSQVSDDYVRLFYSTAIELGADPKMFSPCQFSRMPWGTNGTTKRPQSVLHFDSTQAYHHFTK